MLETIVFTINRRSGLAPAHTINFWTIHSVTSLP